MKTQLMRVRPPIQERIGQTAHLLKSMKKNPLKQITSLCMLLAAGLATTQAAPLTWDPGLSGGSGGTGTWNLNTTANWYNGSADVKWTDSSAAGVDQAIFGGTAGTVSLNAGLSSSNLQFTASGYTLSGSGPLTLGVGGIDATLISSGTTTIGVPLNLVGPQQLWQVGGGGTLAVNGAITRATGAAVDFSASGVTSSTLANDATGIIGPWATVGAANSAGGDWAANDGSGNIIAYTGYTAVTGSQTGAGASAQNWENAGGTATLTASATINSLNQLNDFTVNGGVTLNLNSGGLILGNVSRWLLDGNPSTSFLTSGASTGELFVHVPYASSGNNWTIWPIIENNGATALTLVKDGVGMCKIGNMNTYTGDTLVNAGILASTAGAEYGHGNAPVGIITPFGYGTVRVANGAQLQLGSNPGNAFGEYDYTNPVAVNGGSILASDAFHHLQGSVAVGSAGLTLGATFDGSNDALNKGFAKGLFVDSLFTGAGPTTVQFSGLNTGNAWNSSVVYFTSTGTAAQNTYSGTITVNPSVSPAGNGGSYLFVIGTNALANATINLTGDNSASAGRFGAPSLLFGSGTNLDGIGYATIGGLTGTGDFMLADTLVFQSGTITSSHGVGAAFGLSVGNNNSSTTYSGIISGPGSLTKVGTGTLTLAGANTYTGSTIVNGGGLALSSGASIASANITVAPGATFDVSGVSFTMAGAQSLLGGGTINGSVSTVSGSKIYAGTDGGYGTNVFNNNLTLATGSSVYVDLGTLANGSNDLITVAGNLTANGNVIHIKAPSTSDNLEAADYVLIRSANTISGSFSGIAWDVEPANSAHYSLVTSGNTVILHYTAVTSPKGGGTATPAIAVRNQTILLTVAATNGTGGTVTSITVDASSIGGSASVALVAAGGNVWTNSVAVTPDTAPGSKTLVATLTDTVPLNGLVNIPLTVVAGNDVWNGAGTDNNWSSNLNWTNKTAPGYIGDSLEFAGTTRLTPNMDNNYTNTSVTFDGSAGSFNISSSSSSTLSITGGITNNSANNQTLNVPITLNGAQTFNAAAGDLTISGALADSGAGFTKTGAHALTLSGNNTLTGPALVAGGSVNLSGSIIPSYTTVGSAAGNSVLNLSGNLTAANLFVGNASNTVSAVYQTGGTLNLSGGTGDLLNVGNVSGSYGYFNAAAGTLNINGISIGGESNPNVWPPAGTGDGIMEVNGATVNNSGWIVLARGGDAETGILNVYSGSLTYEGGGIGCNWQLSGSGQTSIINIMGGSVTSADQGVNFRSTDTGILNLNGGLLEGVSVTGPGTLNFDGGTLQAGGIVSPFVSVTSAYVYGKGATIDNNGNGISVSQALLAPTGNGVYGITSFTGGAGYIAPPIITITNGSGDTTGVGATAIAQIDPVAGTVTNIIITCPGVNYTATPIFLVSGGGATTAATITGAAPEANTSGGLTSVGSSTLTLSGASTYTGATIVSNGTLALTGSINNSTNIIVDSGATFDVSAITYTLAANQALSGSGSINGIVNAAAGSKLYGGTDGTYGTNTFYSDLNLASGAACYLDVSTSYTGDNDQLVINGTLTANGNVIHLKAPSTSSSLDTTGDYVLITAANPISGTFAVAPVWDVAPANAGHYSIVTSGNTVTLHYSATASAPTVTASASPTALLCNQTTKITAIVTPGNAAIASVSVDLSSLGDSTVMLVQSNSSSVYTNTVTIPASAAPGSATVTVTATDTSSFSGSTTVPLTINTSAQTWNGGGADQNWSTNPNWVSGIAPGYTGDSLVFAGTAGLSPNMDHDYSITGLTFDNTAGSFAIGSTGNNTLTLTGSGSIVNNSANPQTLNVTVADAGNGITKGGTGAVTLTGYNTYTGPTTVSAGTLNISGSVASTVNTIVGSTAGNSVLNVSGSISPYYMLIGNANGATAAVYQNGGSVSAVATSGYDNLSLGNVPGSYGYYNAMSGSLAVNGIAIAGEVNNGTSSSFGLSGNGVMEINGADVSDTGWLVMARNNNSTNGTEISILNIFSGSLTYAGGGIVGPWDTGKTAIINVMGGSVMNTAAVGVYLGNTGSTGILNLNGGVLEASVITGYNGPSYSPVTYGQLNFNGGTLQASAANAAFISVSRATIYSGGATIDNNGNAITIAQPLQAPTGNGVHGFSSFTGGAGYIAPPIVTIVNGSGDTTGTGATAIAQINPVTGTVTNVVITCPGINYTAVPTFVLSGGGATTPATITGNAPTANTSGGLTAIGAGVTTLSGTNNYTGTTTVNAGTLELVQPVLVPSSTVNIANGAMLQLDFSTTNTVSALVLGGVSQPTGLYNSTTSPSFISGSGSLLVGTPIASNPTNILFSVTSNTLSLSWPADHLGWILQAQTNNLGTGLGTNWVDIAGSGSMTSMSVTVNPASPTVFYRLRKP